MSKHLSGIGDFLRTVPGQQYCVNCCCRAIKASSPEHVREAEHEANVEWAGRHRMDFKVNDKKKCSQCGKQRLVVWFDNG